MICIDSETAIEQSSSIFFELEVLIFVVENFGNLLAQHFPLLPVLRVHVRVVMGDGFPQHLLRELLLLEHVARVLLGVRIGMVLVYVQQKRPPALLGLRVQLLDHVLQLLLRRSSLLFVLALLVSHHLRLELCVHRLGVLVPPSISMCLSNV